MKVAKLHGRVLAAILLGIAAVGTAHSAGAPKVAGYCWVGDSFITYHSEVFQKNSEYFDRDGWTDDFKELLHKRGDNIKWMGGTCRMWKGGSDAVEAAREAQAKDRQATSTSSYNAKLVPVDWIPDGTYRPGEGPVVTERAAESAVEPRVAADSAVNSQPNPSAASPATSKYMEVAGPNGTMRLSPEVIARNKAAAEEHARNMEAHKRAQSDYERKWAEHQESLAKAAAAKKEYEEKLAQSAREAQAHRAAMNSYNEELGKGQTKGGTEGILQSYGAYSETREAAMASLLSRSKNKPELFDIQCAESRPDYYKQSWACWGSYRQIMTRSGVSKQ